MNKKTRQYLTIAVISIVTLALASGGIINLSVLSVSEVKIEPTGNGYVDPASDEWTGDFWFVLMSTDFDDQITAFMLANDDGMPEGTYAQTGNTQGTSDKTYATSTSSGGNQLVPTSNIMVHITPSRPYYEREMEIQQGSYVKEAWSRTNYGVGGWSGKVSPKAEAVPFIHYSFAEIGGGNWILHTPFLVQLYKNGEEIARRNIDTLGGAEAYRLPESGGGEDYINIIDLGKLDTSGYGSPDWTDIFYFSENQIYLRDSNAANLLEYDSGESPTSIMGSAVGQVSADCFSTYWYGKYRWMDDSTPTVTSLSNLPDGWSVEGDTAKPRQPDVFSDVIPYLQSENVRKAPMPTGFDKTAPNGGIEKVYYDGDGDGQSENYLRVYFEYGTKSSLINVKISTAIADTIVWNPQVGNFKFTDYSDFGDIVDIKSHSITVTCIEGAGSAKVKFTKSSGSPLSIVPAFYTPKLEAGESYIIDFDVQNLGTPSTEDFSVTATVENVLGTVTDTVTMYGRLMEKTGSTTIVHVITQDGSKPISNLPVTIFYSGTSQTKTTGVDGLGTATFSLGTTADMTVKAEFAGNALYQPVSETVSVSGASEKTITLSLTKDIVPETEQDWTWIILGFGLMTTAIVAVYLWRRK